MLSFYYFLFLEPHSKRSKDIVHSIQSMYNKNVRIKDEKNIEIFIAPDNPSDFNITVTMMPLFIAGLYSPSAEPTTVYEKFNETSKALFSSIAADIKKKKKKRKNRKDSIIWSLYVPAFRAVEEAGLLPAFTRYITSGTMDESAEWLQNNPEIPGRISETLKARN